MKSAKDKFEELAEEHVCTNCGMCELPNKEEFSDTLVNFYKHSGRIYFDDTECEIHIMAKELIDDFTVREMNVTGNSWPIHRRLTSVLPPKIRAGIRRGHDFLTVESMSTDVSLLREISRKERG